MSPRKNQLESRYESQKMEVLWRPKVISLGFQPGADETDGTTELDALVRMVSRFYVRFNSDSTHLATSSQYSDRVWNTVRNLSEEQYYTLGTCFTSLLHGFHFILLLHLNNLPKTYMLQALKEEVLICKNKYHISIFRGGGYYCWNHCMDRHIFCSGEYHRAKISEYKLRWNDGALSHAEHSLLFDNYNHLQFRKDT